MISVADSTQQAVLKRQGVLACEQNCLKFFTYKQPYNKHWGLIKKNGGYLYEVVRTGKDKASDPDNKDGYIEVILGRAKVSNPVGDGRYASINPCDPNINVYVNGERITDITTVTEKDRIEFVIRSDDNGNTRIMVELSKDRMKAILTIDKFPGRQYYVKDAPKTSLLYVSSGYKEIPAPDVTMIQCLQELQKAGVDLKLVDGTAINRLLGLRYGGSAIVAEGEYPVDGKDSIVEYLFQQGIHRNPDFDTDKTVDLLDHTIIPTVKVGEVLAKKVFFATPGRDGRTVTGEKVKARKGKDIPLKAGEGAVLLDNGTRIVAAANGRPMIKNGMVVVVPLLLVPGNVDPGTGNIYFDGDVEIKGNVMDNMKVAAGGDITVLGNVLHASLSAGGNVNIAGNIISSKVYAGKGVANCLYVLPKIQQIYSIIKMDFSNANSGIHINSNKDMRRRYPDISEKKIKKLEALMADIRIVLGLVPDEEAGLVANILEGLDRIYCRDGLSAGTEQVEKLNKEIQSYLNNTVDLHHRNANLKFGYAQNSSIQACGDVIVTGRGTYQTDIIAKDSITFLKPTSVVRGGILIAGKRMDMGIVGSPAGVKTYCKVLEKNGKINAIRFFGNTILNINNNKQVIS
jgi:hypothetical protein